MRPASDPDPNLESAGDGDDVATEPTEDDGTPIDEVDEWELESFPASDPPQNW